MESNRARKGRIVSQQTATGIRAGTMIHQHAFDSAKAGGEKKRIRFRFPVLPFFPQKRPAMTILPPTREVRKRNRRPRKNRTPSIPRQAMIPRAGTAAAHLGCGGGDDGGVENRDAAAEELNGGVLSPVLLVQASGRGHGPRRRSRPRARSQGTGWHAAVSGMGCRGMERNGMGRRRGSGRRR